LLSGKTGAEGDAMRSSRLFAIGIAIALAAGVAHAEDEAPSLESLEWLAGHWSLEQDGSLMEELWTPPKGGVMLGVHRDVPAGRGAFFEYLRIEQRPEGLVYLASPMGRKATAFPLVGLEDRKVVFENPDHDYPQRIIYEIVGDGMLRARIEGLQGGKPAESEWTWRRSDP
jgi:hypothetical protein